MTISSSTGSTDSTSPTVTSKFNKKFIDDTHQAPSSVTEEREECQSSTNSSSNSNNSSSSSNSSSHRLPEISSLPSSPSSTSTSVDDSLKSKPSAVIDDVDSDTTTTTTTTTTNKKEKKIEFKPGDHITRWEMLPIAWPIQVHGIVLDVDENQIVLVDFGLAASSAAASHPNHHQDIDDDDNDGPKQLLKNFQKTWEKVQKSFQLEERRRLNVLTISKSNKNEISKWSIVNYNGGFLLGFGSSNSNNNDKTENNSNNDINNGGTGDIDSITESSGTNTEESNKPWWKNFGKRKQEEQKQDEETLSIKNKKDDGDFDLVEEIEKRTMMRHLENTLNDDSNEKEKYTTTSHRSSYQDSLSTIPRQKNQEQKQQQYQEKEEEEEEEEEINMNNNTNNSSVDKDKTTIVKSPSMTKNKNKQRTALSKADPTKLVLARTRWILKHGEAVLPPYHAFSSNSECMAVWCKTGCWSTLQADILLHTQAVANIKTSVVVTVGVAATAPLLAPVVGLAGLAGIAAPWLYLNKHKIAAQDAQQKLTDDFWAQAEPEVFVECIEQWTKVLALDDGDDDDDDDDKTDEKYSDDETSVNQDSIVT